MKVWSTVAKSLPIFTNPARMEANLEEPLILLQREKDFSDARSLPVLEQSARTGRALLIIAETSTVDALATLVVNKLRGTIKSLRS